MTVADLACEHFAGQIGSRFALVGEEGTTMPLTLVEATPGAAPASAGGRTPFILLFRSSVQQVVPQGLYTLEHAEMGTLEIFLVPAARTAAGVDYAATFN